ncbi:hypothetical protein PACTADRAFT_52059 [Pachysolen tannophilus NRRL Y-2460]|uniref:t-SNARE coiled-coil homology domain-containing protein n=1 Tax=Pachysolen tannophilus NRRL Y-2460 TaxID=669874 RepID=A0A1E4TP43_PACTA|nr:hypothetical protein PACTADRAFT_52059 [Pachysolen tannophilus NRRL Y-2460]
MSYNNGNGNKTGNNYGYGGNTNPYAEETYELNSYKNEDSDDLVKFMNQISDINNDLDNYQQVIKTVEQRQNSLISQISEEEEEYTRKQLDQLVSEANSIQLSLKSKIKNVQQLAIGDQTKTAQAENSRQRFLELIQSYRIIEANYRDQNKIQAERQFRIVKPDATEEEVKDAIEDAGGQQIFSTALLNANRRGEAKTALQEVQLRHRELQKLEKTMAELTQLFHDMEELVAEQEEQIEDVDEQVEAAQADIEQGIGHTNKAVVSARKARRKKLWCLLICIVIICVIVGAVVGGVVGSRN